MAKLRLSLFKILKYILLSILFLCRVAFRSFIIILPALVVLFVLDNADHPFNFTPGKPPVKIHHFKAPHELFPHTDYGSLKSCGAYFDERAEYERALQCVNKNVWPKSPLKPQATSGLGEPDTVNRIPRCFVVPAESADIVSVPGTIVNVALIQDIFGRVGGVVGVFDPETQTIFLVENVEIAKIYRHELQHLFLHLHDPAHADGGGHDQDIWNKCEPPLYNESPEVKSILKLISDVKKR